MRKIFTLLFFGLFSVTPCYNQGKSNPGQVFGSGSLLQISIESDFDSLIGDMDGERIARPAKISYLDYGNLKVTIDVEISTRGKFRRNPANCDFPPLLLKFSNHPDTGIFSDLEEVKIVTHCKSANREFMQYIWGEYLTYEIYSHLTPFAYQVRPVLFTYINTGSTSPKMNRYGFMIESTKHLEKRLKSKSLKLKEISVNDVDQDAYRRLCFFEYMISNNDWAVSILHNVKMIRPGKYDLPVPVPFDFDWSGILNIPYKIPGTGNNTVLQPERNFQGQFASRKELKTTIHFYNSKKKEIDYLIHSLPYLEDSVKVRYMQQVDEFYEIINSPLAVRKNILKKPLLPMLHTKNKNSLN